MIDFVGFSKQLDEDGFFIWPQLLPEALIDQHLEAFLDLNDQLGVVPGEDFHAYPPEKQEAVKQARYRLHAEHGPTRDLIFNGEFVEFLTHHFGEPAVMRQPETGLFHRATPPHNDALDVRVSPRGAEVRMWCALEDVHQDAGPVYLLPGSHRLITAGLEQDIQSECPELIELLRSQMGETSIEDFYRVTRPLWAYVKRVKFSKALESIPLLPLVLKKGDVAVFRSDLIHGTCRCNQEGLTRAHMLAYWSAQSAIWYQSRAYWGPPHDHRRPENVIPTTIRGTSHGLEISFQDMHAAYLASFERAVVVGEAVSP